MSYTALYRKFRPQSFEEVKGQDHIVKTLINQVNAKRIGHAYLFCGTRGTGKTSVAKILAKAVNCENPQNGSPCGQCHICKAIDSGTSMNSVEIDAASNNSVNDIRQIVEEVEYAPGEGNYRVYIIDEVHMLSSGAFNALLKTLEEPPSYVIFILATTEVHKLPVTILSRCQRYDFHRITIDTIAGRIDELMKAENIGIEERASRYIAKAADGSMRDALSLLDQCIAFNLGENLSYDKVLKVIGAVDTEVFEKILAAVEKQDAALVIKLLDGMISEGMEIMQFTQDFIWYLRNLFLLQSNDNMEDVLDVSTENLAIMKETASRHTAAEIMRYIRVFSTLSNDLRYSSQKRVLLEVALIKLCRPQMERDYDSLISRIEQLEKSVASGLVPAAVPAPQTPPPDEIKEPQVDIEKLKKAVPQEIKQVIKTWKQVIEPVGEKYHVGAVLLENARLGIEGEDTLLIEVEGGLDSQLSKIDNEPSPEDIIRKSIADKFGKQVNIKLSVANNDDQRSKSIDLKSYFGGMDVEIEE